MIFLVYSTSTALGITDPATFKGERIYGKTMPKGERIYGKTMSKGERIYGNAHRLR